MTSKKDEISLASLPFDEKIMRALFNFNEEMMGVAACEHNYKWTEYFLSKHGIEFQKHKDFFVENGGVCDCKIVTVVEENFPIDPNEFKQNEE